MIFVVHGENYAESRRLIINQFLNKVRTNKQELPLSDITPAKLSETILSIDLFGEPQFVILDVTGVKTDAFEKYETVIKNTPAENTVVLLSTKALSKTNPVLKFAQNANVKIIENTTVPEGNIFRFIDTLISQNRPAAYKELTKLTQEGVDTFYLFSMMLYGARNLAHAVTQSSKFEQMKPFQKTALEKRSGKTSLANTKALFGYLYSLDKKTKTGDMQPELMLTLCVEKMLNF